MVFVYRRWWVWRPSGFDRIGDKFTLVVFISFHLFCLFSYLFPQMPYFWFARLVAGRDSLNVSVFWFYRPSISSDQSVSVSPAGLKSVWTSSQLGNKHAAVRCVKNQHCETINDAWTHTQEVCVWRDAEWMKDRKASCRLRSCSSVLVDQFYEPRTFCPRLQSIIWTHCSLRHLSITGERCMWRLLQTPLLY